MFDRTGETLLGKTIVRCRPMTQAEMDHAGWHGTPPLVIVLDDMTTFWAQRDAEGNGPGRLTIVTDDDVWMA